MTKITCTKCGKRISHATRSKHLRFNCKLGLRTKIACQQCSRLFSGETSLRTHMLFHCSVGSRAPKVPCKFCGYKFTTNNLNAHLRTGCVGAKDKEYKKCSFCCLKFYDEQNYLNHQVLCIERSNNGIMLLADVSLGYIKI